MKPAYYNEFDPYAAQWLRNLIAAGLIPYGEVDERPIQSVTRSDLGQFRQCHFFAGIGGWALAARLAGWPDDRELWTGSCPCQPFSNASRGKAKGRNDQRHLWPTWRRLITECRPATIFGEQVASAIDWLIEVRDDLESEGYAFAARVIPAASVGADHRRQRLWFSAHTDVRAEYGGSEHAKTQMLPRCSRYPAGILSANGLPDRMAARSACKGFGNAIVPQVAAQVIGAYLDTLEKAA